MEVQEARQTEPTEEMIAEWKKHGIVYRVSIMGINFYYRNITRAEFRHNLKMTSTGATMYDPSAAADATLQGEELTVQTALLWPKMGLDAVQASPAGMVSKLAELIMEASGFDDASIPEQL